VPNWAPPFPHFFAEWRGRFSWQWGVAVDALEVPDAARADPRPWMATVSAAVNANPPSDEQTYAAVAKSRWVLVCELWHDCPEAGGAAINAGVHVLVFVLPDGKHTGMTMAGFGRDLLASYFRDSPYSVLVTFGMGLSFCHCKNVTRTEYTAEEHHQWHRQTKVPRLKYYVLNIDPMRETLRREGRSEEVGLGKALHICRGHFATYTPEHPLFGKYVGTFWRPDHVRGKAENGIVDKDYSVNPGQETNQ
jgi:hypothetical protein